MQAKARVRRRPGLMCGCESREAQTNPTWGCMLRGLFRHLTRISPTLFHCRAVSQHRPPVHHHRLLKPMSSADAAAAAGGDGGEKTISKKYACTSHALNSFYSLCRCCLIWFEGRLRGTHAPLFSRTACVVVTWFCCARVCVSVSKSA
jgi:hypothetical protein